MTSLHRVLLCLILPSSFVPAAMAQDAARFVESAHAFPRFSSPQQLLIRDLDGDGKDDVVFLATSGFTKLLFVAGMTADGSIGLKQSTVIEGDPDRMWLGRVGGVDQLFLGGYSQPLARWSGWPLRQQGWLHLPSGSQPGEVADVNADGDDEMIVTFDQSIGSLVLATGQLLWETPLPYAPGGVAFINADADPALEVLATGPNSSHLLDGTSGAIDAAIGRRYTANVQGGRLALNGGWEFADSVGSVLSVSAGAAPWANLWSIPVPFGASSYAVADVDGDGRDELIYGDAQHNAGVHVIDSVSRVERFQIPGSGYGVYAIAVADIGDDAAREIAYSTGGFGVGGRGMRIGFASSVSGLVLGAVNTLPGRFGTVALGDTDADGHLDVVAASTENAGDDAVMITAASDGALRWLSPAAGTGYAPSCEIAVRAIEIGTLSAQTGARIVLGGGTSHAGCIVVIDGSNNTLIREISTFTPTMNSRAVAGLALVDVDDDGTRDIIAATQSLSTLTTGARLFAYSGATGELLLGSPAVGADFAEVKGLLSADVNQDQRDELVLVLPDAVHLFDSNTLLPIGSYPISSGGARVISREGAAPELASFSEGGVIRFHDLSNGQLLRTLEGPGVMTGLLVLESGPLRLVVAAGGRLHWLDGSSGAVLASSDYLGSRLAAANQLAALPISAGLWQLAVGGDAGYFSLRLETAAAIFEAGFDDSAVVAGRAFR